MTTKQPSLPFESGVLFGSNFLADHAGQLMLDGRLALIELVANAYDAGATNVEIAWPSETEGPFSIEDNGTGMTTEEFQRRWRTLGYNRTQEQGRWAEVPPKSELRRRSRLAFGQSGKGRHGAFCFADSYEVTTWRDGTLLTGTVRLTPGGSEPFEFADFATRKRKGHGTRISTIVRKHLLSDAQVSVAIGSKFLVDPAFNVSVNGVALSLLDLDTVASEDIEVGEHGTITVHEIDPNASDRTTHMRGITWWVQGRMVGAPSWDGLDKAGAILDGRTAVAKRLSYVIQADVMKPDVKADWRGFHATERSNAVIKTAREHIIRRLEGHLADTRTSRKRQALKETADSLKGLSSVSHRAIGEFTDSVLATCPSISQGDLSRTVAVFANLEKARSGYSLLGELATCSPDDLDRWTEIMRRWSASDAETVLNELYWRLELIKDLELLTERQSDELHEIQPLFERGLWIFGPEYEAKDFRSNRAMVTVVAELFGGNPEGASSKRPDFVALPDRTVGVYAADSYDEEGEVSGVAKVLIVELKRGGSTLTRKEVAQPEEYVTELRSNHHVQATTKFDVFVLGTLLADDAADERTVGQHTVIRPMKYERVLKRAHSRTFHLLEKVRGAFPEAGRDADVEAVLGDEAGLFDDVQMVAEREQA